MFFVTPAGAAKKVNAPKTGERSSKELQQIEKKARFVVDFGNIYRNWDGSKTSPRGEKLERGEKAVNLLYGGFIYNILSIYIMAVFCLGLFVQVLIVWGRQERWPGVISQTLRGKT